MATHSIALAWAASADVVLDHTATQVAGELTEPVDVLLDLADVGAQALVEPTAHVRDGRVVVNTVPMLAGVTRGWDADSCRKGRRYPPDVDPERLRSWTSSRHRVATTTAHRAPAH